MNTRKIIFVLTFLIFTVIFITSCAKLTREEYIDVEAIITNVYYKPSYKTLIMVGRVPMYKKHRAKYRITVKYEGKEYNISGRKFYKKNKNKIGKSIKVVLRKRYYDDGSVRQDIEAPDKTDDKRSKK